MNIYERMLDYVLPPRCLVSGDIVDAQGMIAPHIWRQLQFVGAPYCTCCGVPFEFEVKGQPTCAQCQAEAPVYARARSALVYDEISKDMILKFKYADQLHAVSTFIQWMALAGQELLEDADFLVPVPLHRWRLLKRRYNQAAILANALSSYTHIPALPDGLLRVRATASQGHMNYKKRKANVRNAFVVPPKNREILRNKKVILVDDVLTTGATVSSCAEALYSERVDRVEVLTVAKVVRPKYIL